MVGIKSVIVIISTAFMLASSAGVVEVGSNELIDNAREYDKKVVIYSGEVVGDIMLRGQYAWINVSDGDNAIGIWITAEDSKMIDNTGKYGVRGDTVKVQGIFNRACVEHGGDFDIHAKKFEITGRSSNIQWKPNTITIIIATVIFIAAIALNLIIFRKKL